LACLRISAKVVLAFASLLFAFVVPPAKLKGIQNSPRAETGTGLTELDVTLENGEATLLRLTIDKPVESHVGEFKIQHEPDDMIVRLSETDTPGNMRLIAAWRPNFGSGLTLVEGTLRLIRAKEVFRSYSIRAHLRDQGSMDSSADCGGSAEGSGPVISVSPMIIDFGTLQARSRAVARFSVNNNGDSPLEVVQMRAGCGGCVEIEPTHFTVAPAHRKVVTLTFTAADRDTVSAQWLNILSNDNARPLQRIVLIAETRCEYLVVPSVLDFGQVEPGQGKSITATIRRNDEQPYAILAMTKRGAGTGQLNYTLQSAEPDVEHRLVFSVIGSRARRALSASVLLTLDLGSGVEQEMSIPIKGQFTGWLQAIPEEVFVGSLRGTETVQKAVHITFHAGAGSPDKVSIKTPDWIRAHLSTEQQDPRNCRINVTVDAAMLSPGMNRGHIALADKENDKNPVVKLLILAYKL